MLVVGSLAIIEDRILRGKVRRIWTEPRVDVPGLDWDDAAIVASSGYLWRRLVSDRGKRLRISAKPNRDFG